MITTIFDNGGREFDNIPIQIEHEDGIAYACYNLAGDIIQTNFEQDAKAHELIASYHQDQWTQELEARHEERMLGGM